MIQKTEAIKFALWMLKMQNIHYANFERMDAASSTIVEPEQV